MNDDVSDYVDVKHMEISGKFRVTSSRQRAIAFRMTKALVKIKITLRRGPPRTSSPGKQPAILKAASQSLRS